VQFHAWVLELHGVLGGTSEHNMAQANGLAVMIRNGLNKQRKRNDITKKMTLLYKYIFCKAYYFCIWAFKEREFPWAWAGMTISMIIVGTIITLLKLAEVLMIPERFNIYGEYHGYFSVGMAVIILFYVKHDNRYVKILEECNNLPARRRKILRYVSVAYLLILVVSFFWLGEIIRDFNLSHRG
jgi:hypothetical protein